MRTYDIGVLLANNELSQDEPCNLSDEDLLRLAHAACEELRRRMPRYALEQDDLPPGSEHAVEVAEEAVRAVEKLKDAWTT